MKNTSDFYRLIIKNIIRIGLPVAVQSMLVALLSLTDVVMVSPFGKESAAAVGVASKWHFLLIMIMSGIAQASGIIIAQFAGKKDFKSAKMIFRKSVYTGMLIFIIPVLLLTFIPQYFLMLQTDDELVIANGCTYLFFCSIIQLLTFYVIVCESALRSSGDGFTPLLFGAITIFLNIFFNYCLIGGNFGFDALGVKGAALATSIARILQFVMLITFFIVRKHWLYTETAIALKDTVVKRLKNLSISCAISSVIFAVGSMVCQILIGKTGTAELAVYCILDPFLSLMYGFYYGLAVAASVTIGSLLGKKEFTDAKKVASGFLRM
ncbi:MAG: MATE family efflux transporter, partial [Succinivibrio sp.]